jgi:hypothetical protein
MPIVEDRTVALTGERLGIRQWRCLNGHSVTWNPVRWIPRVYAWLLRCDVCGGALLATAHGGDLPRRHATCAPGHERARVRSRRAGVSLGESTKPPVMGSRWLTSLALTHAAALKNFTPKKFPEGSES